MAKGSTVDLEHPVRRAPIRVWNGAAAALARGGSSDAELAVDALMRAAVRRTGCADFGTETFVEPLRRLSESLNRSAGLHPFGRFLARQMLIELLCNRLYTEAEWSRGSKQTDGGLARPLVIVGLPRTGTTFLFNLLACDPNHRFLTNWEANRPAPPPGRWSRNRAGRRLLSKIGLGLHYYLTPPLKVIRECRVDGPEECTRLLMAEFTSQAFAAAFNVPEYLAWLDGCDYAPSLRYHRRQLALLPVDRGQRWLLKSPNHTPALAALMATYPDACIIQMHRDPAKVIPSCASLVAALRSLFSDRLDGEEIGEQTAHLLLRSLRASAAAREVSRSDQFYDVRYADLASDPIGVVQRIYRHFELPLSQRCEDRIRAISATPRRHPRHRYSLEQFGLDAAAVRDLFGWYSARFDVPAEEPSAGPPGRMNGRGRSGAFPSKRRGRLFGFLRPFTSYLLTNLSGTLLWFYLFALNRTTVFGRGNVGEEPNTLLLSNHQTPLDSFLVGLAAFYPRCLIKPGLLPWNPAAVEHFYTNRFTAWLAENWRCIPVQKGRRDAGALRLMTRLLPDGMMIVFPEGARSRDGSVGTGRPGAGFVVLGVRPRVVPVAIEGMHEIWPIDGFALRLFKRIYVSFGKPVDCSDLFAMPRGRQTAQLVVDRVMRAIRAQQAELRRLRERPAGAQAG